VCAPGKACPTARPARVISIFQTILIWAAALALRSFADNPAFRSDIDNINYIFPMKTKPRINGALFYGGKFETPYLLAYLLLRRGKDPTA
jgi:hypothetical protein